MLERLFQLYPKLFGARFLPLKLGVFQELMALHASEFTKDELKAALGVHARSTRYLDSVASGAKRHDLNGVAVEDVAPEHVHHAIMEVFRRRQARSREDLRPWLRSRLVKAIEASGLTREQYSERVPTQDPLAAAALDEALPSWRNSPPSARPCAAPSKPAAKPWKRSPRCTGWTCKWCAGLWADAPSPTRPGGQAAPLSLFLDPVLRRQLRLHRRRHRLVVAERQRVAALAAGQRVQARLVARQFRQRRLRQHGQRRRWPRRVPLTWPRRDARSPVMSPMFCSGAAISTLTIGSSTLGRAACTAAMHGLACRPVMKAISLLSTVWCLPS